MKDKNGMMERLREAMGASSNKELAAALFVSESALRHFYKGGIPAQHLLAAARRGFHPNWVETGQGPKYMIASNFPCFAEYPRLKVGLPEEVRA